MRWFSDYKWVILILVVLPFLVGFLISLPRWSLWSFAGNDNVWLNFWASYISGMGSVLMTFIAYQTLSISKRQICPRIYPSIDIVAQKQYDPQACNEDSKWYNEFFYCLHIKNYGVEPATKIKLKVGCNNEDLHKNDILGANLDWLNNAEFALGPKEEKKIYLFPAEITPKIRRNEKQKNNFWYDNFLIKFKECDVVVEVSYYEEDKDTTKIFRFPMSNLSTSQTTLIQVLDNINRSIQMLQNR